LECSENTILDSLVEISKFKFPKGVIEHQNLDFLNNLAKYNIFKQL